MSVDEERELRLAEIRRLEQDFEDQDFMIRGLDILDKWRQDVGPDLTLRASHTLLPIASVEQVLRGHMIEFCERWKKRFPLRATSSREILFPHADDLRLIELARAEVIKQLAVARLTATGLDARTPLARHRKIPSESWRAFIVDFENSRVSTGDFSLLDVRVSAADAPRAQPQGRMKVSIAALRSWLTARKDNWSDLAPYPGEVDDRLEAEEKLGGQIPREIFRKARAKIIPAEWRSVGRRRKFIAAEPQKGKRGAYSPKYTPK